MTKTLIEIKIKCETYKNKIEFKVIIKNNNSI